MSEPLRLTKEQEERLNACLRQALLHSTDGRIELTRSHELAEVDQDFKVMDNQILVSAKIISRKVMDGIRQDLGQEPDDQDPDTITVVVTEDQRREALNVHVMTAPPKVNWTSAYSPSRHKRGNKARREWWNR